MTDGSPITACSEHSSLMSSQSVPAYCHTSATVSICGSSCLASRIVRQSKDWIIARSCRLLSWMSLTTLAVKTS